MQHTAGSTSEQVDSRVSGIWDRMYWAASWVNIRICCTWGLRKTRKGAHNFIQWICLYPASYTIHMMPRPNLVLPFTAVMNLASSRDKILALSHFEHQGEFSIVWKINERSLWSCNCARAWLDRVGAIQLDEVVVRCKTCSNQQQTYLLEPHLCRRWRLAWSPLRFLPPWEKLWYWTKGQ